MNRIVEVLSTWVLLLALMVPVGMAIAAIHISLDSAQRQLELAQSIQFPQARQIVLEHTEYREPPPPQTGEQQIDPAELNCMAMNVFHEARGESFVGKLAVAHVTMNRVRHESYPNTVCSVVFQAQRDHRGNPIRNRCQFSWHCNGRSDDVPLYDRNGRPLRLNHIAWEESIAASRLAMTEDVYDPTHGATHYYNPQLAQPFWSAHYEHVTEIDNHSFYRMVRR